MSVNRSANLCPWTGWSICVREQECQSVSVNRMVNLCPWTGVSICVREQECQWRKRTAEVSIKKFRTKAVIYNLQLVYKPWIYVKILGFSPKQLPIFCSSSDIDFALFTGGTCKESVTPLENVFLTFHSSPLNRFSVQNKSSFKCMHSSNQIGQDTRSRGLPIKLTGPQTVRKFPKFYETWRFINTFTIARYLSILNPIALNKDPF